MYARVEPSGCCVRKGKVRLRFSMYLDEGDAGYDIHHIQVPERPLTDGERADPELAELVPKVWQNNPFHNYFVYINPDTSDAEIKQLMAELLNEFFNIWGKNRELINFYKPKKRPTVKSAENIEECQLKVEDIKNRASEFEVRS